MKKALRFIGVSAFWLGIWYILSLIAGKEVLLPSPIVTLKTLFSLMGTASFWVYCGASVLRIITGLLLGGLFGALLASLTCKSSVASHLISPILSVIRATPVASFIILALVWLGRGNVPSFTSFLMVLPVVWGSVVSGIRAIDKSLLEMASVFRLSPVKKLTQLYIPAVLPSFFSGMRTGMGLAWKAGIAAEVICNPKYGIGSALYDSKVYLNTAELFAWTAAVIIISMGFELIFDRIFALFTRKGTKANEG